VSQSARIHKTPYKLRSTADSSFISATKSPFLRAKTQGEIITHHWVGAMHMTAFGTMERLDLGNKLGISRSCIHGYGAIGLQRSSKGNKTASYQH
jgi:hypothetical protein